MAKQDRKVAKIHKNIQKIGKIFTMFEKDTQACDHCMHERPMIYTAKGNETVSNNSELTVWNL